MTWLVGIVGGLLLLGSPALAQTLPPIGTRLDTFSPSGTRTGTVERAYPNPDGSRLDLFDPSGRRRGYGEVNRYGDGKVDFYDRRGRRLGTGVPSGGPRR